MKGGVLQGMAPNARRAFFTTVVLGLMASAIYVLAVEPATAALARERTRLSELRDRQRHMEADLGSVGTVKKTLADLEAEMKPFREARLTPLLGSYAMRAKSLLDPLTAGAGLIDVEYSNEPSRALPLPLPMPRQLHTRVAVRLSAHGSYQAIVSFLLMLERDFPLVSLQSLQILAQQNPAKQTATMILEWPAKGGLSRQ